MYRWFLIGMVCLMTPSFVKAISLDDNVIRSEGSCFVPLFSPAENFLRMFFSQVESILQKTDVTSRNEVAVRRILHTIRGWERREKQRLEDHRQRPTNLYVYTFLQIAHFFRMQPSRMFELAEREELEAHIDIESLQLNTHLGDEDKRRLLMSVGMTLQQSLRSLLKSRENPDGYTLEELAEVMGVVASSLSYTVHQGHTPTYFIFYHILEELDMNMVTFFQKVEAQEGFDILVQDIFPRDRDQQAEERQLLEHVGHLVRSALTFRGFDSSQQTLDLTGLHRTEIGQVNSSFLNLVVRSARNVGLPPHVFVDKSVSINELEDMIRQSPFLITEDFVSSEEDYLQKASVVLTYLIKVRMAELGLPVSVLAARSGLSGKTIRELVEKGMPLNMRFFNVYRVVNDGLEMNLVEFLKDFERQMAIADWPEIASIQVPSQDDFSLFENDFLFLKTRLLKAWDRIKGSVNRTSLRRITGLDVHNISLENHNLQLIRMEILISFAHFLRITVAQLVSEEDLSLLIDPTNLNLERLTEQQVLSALQALTENIKNKRENLGISENELMLRTGVANHFHLNPILHGYRSAGYYRFVQVSKALDVDKASLLEGIDLL